MIGGAVKPRILSVVGYAAVGPDRRLRHALVHDHAAEAMRAACMAQREPGRELKWPELAARGWELIPVRTSPIGDDDAPVEGTRPPDARRLREAAAS